MKKFFVGVLAAVLAVSLVTEDVQARRGGGGFSGSRSSGFSSRPSTSRSWSSKPSYSRSSPSKSSSSSRPSTSSSSWNTKPSASRSSASKPVVNKLTGSKVDAKVYEKAKANGTAFTSKSAAVSSFKSRAKTDPAVQKSLSEKYPTSFSKEPTTRPSYVPQTYGGNTVVYNNGGYGYFSGGAWVPLMSYMLLDSMSDAALASSMSRHGYYVGSAPASSGGSVIGFLVFLALVGVVLGGAVIYYHRRWL